MVHNESTNALSIYDFTLSTFKRIWESEAHQRVSLKKIERFSEFEDYVSRPITNYRPTHIYNFLEFREEAYGNSAATQNRYIAALSKVFKHYDDEYKTDITPRLKWKRENGGRPRFFTLEEQSQLKDILSNSGYPWTSHIVTIALKSGMRKSEILGIGKSRDQVKADQPYGEISRDLSKVYLRRTKNGDDRVVHLHPEALKALEALDFNPSKHYDHHHFYAVWDKARRRIAKGDDTFVFHVTRHTAATTLASLGFNTVKIGKMLGHKTIVTTAKYIHEDEETSIKMINSL